MVYMKAIVNGTRGDYTEQEIKYLKEMYGYWEDINGTIVFNRYDFLNVGQMAELLNIQDKSIYQRHKRHPNKYPLEKRGTAMGVASDKFLKYWV